jgi:DNA-binding HxlR family transcriptional regulator
MTRTSLDHWQCSVARAADLLGDKWTLMIIRDAFYGLSTFSQFQKNLNVARNILSDRLEKLVEGGILRRVQSRPNVERYHYALTEAGRDLFPVIVALMHWGDEWVFKKEGEPVLLVDREKEAPIRKLTVQDSDGQPVGVRDVTFQPGPSAAPELIAFYKRLQS